MGKTLNFDLFMQEQRRDMLTVTVFGKEYTIPMEIPAIVPVTMARAEETMDRQASTNMVMKAADALFGADAVSEMCRNGMSARNLVALIEHVFAEINGKTIADDDSEEVDDESGLVQADARKQAKK